ncbi:unnamed protein product, partial [Ilex paraguariensis]
YAVLQPLSNHHDDELISYMSEVRTQMLYLSPIAAVPTDLERLAIEMEMTLHERHPDMAPSVNVRNRLYPPPSFAATPPNQQRPEAIQRRTTPPGFAVLQYQGHPNVPRPAPRSMAPIQMPPPSSFDRSTAQPQQPTQSLPSYVYRPAPKVAIPISSSQLHSSMPYSMLTVQASTVQQSITNATATVSTTSRPSRTSNEIDSTTEPPRRYSRCPLLTRTMTMMTDMNRRFRSSSPMMMGVTRPSRFRRTEKKNSPSLSNLQLTETNWRRDDELHARLPSNE